MPSRRVHFAMDLEQDASFTVKANDGSAKNKKTEEASSLDVPDASENKDSEVKSEKEEPPQANIAFLCYS